MNISGTSGYFRIDKYNSATTTGSHYAMRGTLAYDSICATGQTVTNTGISLAVDSSVPTMVGTVNNYGADITVAGGTSGTQNNLGLQVRSIGADNNAGIRVITDGMHLTLLRESNNSHLCDIEVEAGGNTTIKPTGWAKINADYILLDGDTGEDVMFLHDGTRYGYIGSHHSASWFTLFEAGGASENDWFEIKVEEGGLTTISTIDAADKNAHLMFIVDGVVHFLQNEWFVLIDRNTSGDDAEDAKGLWVDFDRTVATSGTAAHNDVGIKLDVTSASLGTSTVKGMDIDVVGATSGTHTATGIDLDVDGSDTNIGIIINTAGTHMKLVANADANDYATFTLADTGDLTIATVGDGTTDSDLILVIDGDLSIDVDGGDATIADAGGTYTPSADASIATKKYVDDNAGGTNSIVFGTSFRGRNQYNNWYTWNYAYGMNYYYWLQTTSSASLPASYSDSYCPGHIVPAAGKVVGYTFIGNVTTTDTFEFAIMKGNLAGGFGSAGDWTLSQIGSTQSAGGTSNIMYKWEQASGSFAGVAVAAGDMIVPYFRRTTDNDSTFSYVEMSYTIVMELD